MRLLIAALLLFLLPVTALGQSAPDSSATPQITAVPNSVTGTYKTYFEDTGRSVYMKITESRLFVLAIFRSGECAGFPSVIGWTGDGIVHMKGTKWKVSPREDGSLDITYPATKIPEEAPETTVTYEPAFTVPIDRCRASKRI